ncbi:MAG TPA: response regulator [Chitinophagaceae bacterium]|nr:response regulator [Chitinophagaceae bacterium]
MNNEQIHILLAEDDEADRLLFSETLDELEIKPILHTVNNGVELMAYLNKKNVQLPHIVFLDLNMPRKNGLECLKEIRNNDKLKSISIAIYSTSVNENDMDETFRYGANVYISKPNNINMLRQLFFKAVAATHLYQGEPIYRANFFLSV